MESHPQVDCDPSTFEGTSGNDKKDKVPVILKNKNKLVFWVIYFPCQGCDTFGDLPKKKNVCFSFFFQTSRQGAP